MNNVEVKEKPDRCPINKTTGQKMHTVRWLKDSYGHHWRACIVCGAYEVRTEKLQANLAMHGHHWRACIVCGAYEVRTEKLQANLAMQ